MELKRFLFAKARNLLTLKRLLIPPGQFKYRTRYCQVIELTARHCKWSAAVGDSGIPNGEHSMPPVRHVLAFLACFWPNIPSPGHPILPFDLFNLCPVLCPRSPKRIQIKPTGVKIGGRYEIEIASLQCDLLQLFISCIEKLSCPVTFLLSRDIIHHDEQDKRPVRTGDRLSPAASTGQGRGCSLV